MIFNLPGALTFEIRFYLWAWRICRTKVFNCLSTVVTHDIYLRLLHPGRGKVMKRRVIMCQTVAICICCCCCCSAAAVALLLCLCCCCCCCFRVLLMLAFTEHLRKSAINCSHIHRKVAASCERSHPSTPLKGDFHIDDSNSFAPEILEHGTITRRMATWRLGLYYFDKSRIFIKSSFLYVLLA